MPLVFDTVSSRYHEYPRIGSFITIEEESRHTMHKMPTEAFSRFNAGGFNGGILLVNSLEHCGVEVSV